MRQGWGVFGRPPRQDSWFAYQARLTAAGLGAITTDIVSPAPDFYFAEDEHQQYLSKHPGGYCGLAGAPTP